MKRIIKRLTSARHLKRLVLIHDQVANLHNCPRHAISSSGDRALRSGAIIVWREIAEPGIATERQGKSAPFSHAGIVDIAPTVLDLLGLTAPASICGASLLATEVRDHAATIETFEAISGGFRQRLAIRRRGAHLFPVHGGLIG